MHSKVNAYLAILFITILGAGAASIIMHVAETKSVGDRAQYADLQKSILEPGTQP